MGFLFNSFVGGAGFTIHSHNSSSMAARGYCLHDTMVSLAKLREASEGFAFTILVLKPSNIVVEGDSKTVVGWLSKPISIWMIHLTLFWQKLGR